MEQKFYDEIKNILITARNKVYQTANFAMVEAYWNIGKSIIEEQGGNEKAIMSPTQFATQCVAIWKCQIKLPHIFQIGNSKSFSKILSHLFR